MKQKQNFIHLRTHTAYSLAEGMLSVDRLVDICKEEKIPAIAMTDTNNMFGAAEFSFKMTQNGIQPILGAQLLIEDESFSGNLVLISKTRKGYENLSRLVTMESASKVFEDQKLTLKTLSQYAEGLICMSGGYGGGVNTLILQNRVEESRKNISLLKQIFKSDFYIEIQRHNHSNEDEVEAILLEEAMLQKIPLVATNDCYFESSKNHRAHDALLCIADGRYISEADRRSFRPEQYLASPAEMVERFKDIPEAINNTINISLKVEYTLEKSDILFPIFKTRDNRSPDEELKIQSFKGLEDRFQVLNITGGALHKTYRDRIKYELSIISSMGFSGYFLIVADFIIWAKNNNIPVGPGRGSGAGSLVAWAIGITDINPIQYNLLFERLLNPERVSMPDFDVDFCQERREEVIAYVQQKYGAEKVAQIITFGKLQARAVVRDVGRVLQMPYGQVDRIAKMIPNNPNNPMTLAQAIEQDNEFSVERKKDERADNLLNLALQLEGLYRHASTHAAGVVIGDRDLQDLLPLYYDSRSEMPATQYNMKYIEDIGLIKFDFLGLKTLTVLQKTLEHIGNSELNLLTIPYDDVETFNMLAGGDTVGIFQLEGAGMTDTIRKLKPHCFEDIIALVSLYRPGPMDNIPQFLKNKHGDGCDIDYMHPKLEPVLKETYGIMVYQEQVMQAAQVLAGYSLGGADLLRRAMGKKIKAEMDKQREIFVSGCKSHNNIDKKLAEHIFDQIAKFAGYGFNKSHAAAYSMISYQTAYLKCHYPVEFMAASMTLDKGNTDKLSIFAQDLKDHDIELLGPDINASHHVFKPENEGVRYALSALKGVGEGLAEAIRSERKSGGPYKSIEDFLKRMPAKLLNKRQIEQLSAAGAFDSLNLDRKILYEYSDLIMLKAQSFNQEKETGQVSLFSTDEAAQDMDKIKFPPTKPWRALEAIQAEYGAIGFYLSSHPLASYDAQIKNSNILYYNDVRQILEDTQAVRKKVAAVLIDRQNRISAKGNKYAFLKLSDPTGSYEATCFGDILIEAKDILKTGAPLLVTLQAETQEDSLRLTIYGIEALEGALQRKAAAIERTITNENDLTELYEILKPEQRGGVPVSITLKTEEGEAMLSLPGRWRAESLIE